MSRSLLKVFCILYILFGLFSQTTARGKGIRETGPPCPDDALISPCTCSYDADTLDIDLSCRWVQNENELRGIFNQELPVYDYASLDIWQESMSYAYNISQLTSGVFGNCTFEYINFEYTDVLTIDPDVFENMKGKIQHISFRYNPLEEFSFDFADYPALEIISLRSNSKLENIRLSAPTVKLFFAYGGHLKASTLTLSLPDATTIDIADNRFGDVPDLSKSVVLEKLYLDGNFLSSIEDGALCHSPNLNLVSLSYNAISNVTANSLCVKNGSSSDATYVYFGVNELTTLDQETWQPITRASNSLSLSNNPLNCGCEIEWLYTEENLIDHVSSSSSCWYGKNLHDFDSGDFNHCH